MMRRIRSLFGQGVRHPNFQAMSVALAAAGAVVLNTDPLPAGSDPLGIVETELAVATGSLCPQIVVPPAPPLAQLPLGDGLDPIAEAALADSAAQSAPASVNPAAAESPVLTGKWAMQMTVVLLQKGVAQFSTIPDYTSTFVKRERIGGDLTAEQQIQLKVRHAPFSVYMKWRSGETGQQVIYVNGQNEGKMLVKPGGLKGRVAGTLSVDPDSSLARSQARYPVTMIGLTALAETILKFQETQIARGTGFECELRDDALFDERPCYRYLVTYAGREFSPDYRKSEILIDKEWSMPVYVRNYTWAKDANPETLDDDTLVEMYAYTEVQVRQQLADMEFDRTNQSYRMTR
ncbi:MAG: DUF1571 domain-containing protein [Planctomyces sp.]|nr:DUF1571 domain-containing protein [Planctomyces sp.]